MPFWAKILTFIRLCIIVLTFTLLLSMSASSPREAGLLLFTAIYLAVFIIPRGVFLYGMIRKKDWAGMCLTISTLGEMVVIALCISSAGAFNQQAEQSQVPGAAKYAAPYVILCYLFLGPLLALDLLDLLFTRKAMEKQAAGHEGKEQGGAL